MGLRTGPKDHELIAPAGVNYGVNWRLQVALKGPRRRAGCARGSVFERFLEQDALGRGVERDSDKREIGNGPG